MLPTKLKFTSGGWSADATRIEWQQGKLHCQLACGDYVWRKETTTVPSPEAWAEFWDSVEKAGVWDWEANYNTEVLDGWRWELELEQAGRRIASNGSNACPGGEGEDSSFEQFRRALLKLVGVAKLK